MANKYISKIKSSNNDVNYLKYGIYPVKGTQTSATGTWTGVLNVPALYDGLTIAYYLPYNGSGNATLNLTLSDGTTTGAVNCYWTNNSRLTTHYAAGNTIILTYWSAGSIKINGTATTDNRWTTSDYDSNTTYALVSTTANGLAPQLSGSATQYLNGTGTWTTPTNTTYANVTSSAAGLAPASGNTANKVLRVSPSGNPIWGSDDSRELMPFNNPTTNSASYRLTSANITPNNNGSIRTFLATSNMTTDTRPANDGNILHFSWDNQNRWGSQMAICHGNPPIVQVRHQTGAGQNDWGPWKKLIRQDDLATTADNGLTPKLNGSTLQHLRGDGTWAIPRQASRIIDANNNSSEISVQYSGSGISGASWMAAFDGYAIKPMSTAVLKSIVDTKKEAFFEWGGQNLAGAYSPIDAALVGWLGANRFAGIPAGAVTIEYSRDAGSTWTDYGASDAAKRDFFTSRNSFAIGKADSTNKATANGNKYQLRVTINTQTGNVYTALNKFIIYLSTSGSNNCTVKVQAAIQNTPDNYVDITGDVPLYGWSGWNVINVSPFTTYGNQVASQYGRVRFIFKANGGNTSYNGMNIFSIYGYGGMGWTTPSDLARSGQLYSYDGSLNATFPANLTAQSGTLNGSLTFSKSATNAIQYTGTCATYPMIKFMDQADGNGNGMAIGGGGAVIVGGGESSNAAMAQVAGGSEVLYLCNDGNVNVFTNMQNGWASRKQFYFDTNGDFHTPRYIYANYLNASNGTQTPSSTSYWVYANSDGFLRKSTPANALTNLGGAKASQAIKSITRSGVTFTATRCDGSTFSFTQQDNNNTYAAGAGLALNGSTFRTTIPRVAKSANSIPGANTVIFEEYTGGSNYNLPSNAFYHIITMEGPDTKYATQLALGMNTEAAYYRNYNNSTWGSWKGILNSNTWRGIQNVLTSTSTVDSLSANQGRLLANGSARDSTKLPLTGGTLTGALSIKNAGGVQVCNNNSSVMSQLGYNTTYGGFLQCYSTAAKSLAQIGRIKVSNSYGTLVNWQPTLVFYDDQGIPTSFYSVKRALIMDPNHSGYVVHGETMNHGITIDYVTSGRINFYVDTTSIGYCTITSSDERVKTDIKPLGERYKDAIQTLDLKEFRYDFRDPVRSEANGLKRFGVIAQDVIAALDEQGLDWQKSELVETIKDENSEYYAVNYIPLLITRLAGDEDRIKQLENTVASLTARLEALEQKLKNL